MKTRNRIPLLALGVTLLLAGHVATLHAAANLVVTSISGPTQAYLNATIPVTCQVKNIGDTASGAYEVGLYLSADKSIQPAADRLLKKVFLTDGLAPGQARKTTARVTVSSGYLHPLSGSYYYGAVVASNQKASMKQVAIVRYEDNGDGTVTDFKTGLMWQKNDDYDARSWDEAVAYCDGLVLGGHKDWSLPPIEALETLVDYTRSDPAIDPVFESCHTDYYWSSTTDSASSNNAWYVYFFRGDVDWRLKLYSNYVRCVREAP